MIFDKIMTSTSANLNYIVTIVTKIVSILNPFKGVIMDIIGKIVVGNKRPLLRSCCIIEYSLDTILLII
jgi:MFS-type transporter involved in bile tolerance (Atg22 family)